MINNYLIHFLFLIDIKHDLLAQ